MTSALARSTVLVVAALSIIACSAHVVPPAGPQASRNRSVMVAVPVPEEIVLAGAAPGGAGLAVRLASRGALR